MSELDVRDQAALLVWPAVYPDDWENGVDVVATSGVGGVLLMDVGTTTTDELAQLLGELEGASRHGLIISTDEEGGDVQRLRSIAPLRSQQSVSSDLTPDQARDLVTAHGQLIRRTGVDMVLGPVVDVIPNVGDVALQRSRMFIGAPAEVSAFGEAYLRGWQDADLFAALKHYPGHGAASGDTHITAGVTPSLDDLRAFDLLPYAALTDTALDASAAVMIGHLTVPGLTDGVPATRSPAAIDYLRNDLGYGDALLISDALGMAAVGLPEPEASVLALIAGIDVVLFTRTTQAAPVIDAIARAVTDGSLSEQHVVDAAAKVMAMLMRDGHSCNTPAS